MLFFVAPEIRIVECELPKGCELTLDAIQPGGAQPHEDPPPRIRTGPQHLFQLFVADVLPILGWFGGVPLQIGNGIFGDQLILNRSIENGSSSR